MSREITEGEQLKWGYGYCWTNYNRMTITTALIPFNFLLRWGREIYFWLASPERAKHEMEIAEKIRQSYKEGYEYGKKHNEDFYLKKMVDILQAKTNPNE